MLSRAKKQVPIDMSDGLVNFLNTAVLGFDADLKISFINSAAESLLDVSGNRALGQGLSELMDNNAEFQQILCDALANEQVYNGRKVKLCLAGGSSITCDYTVSPVNIDNNRLLVELHPLDRYLRMDRDENISAQQDVTRQLIRGLAHEIKNPLGGIRGSAQLLARELPSEDLTPYTDIIVDETDRLTALVDRLLGPKSIPQPKLCNIHEVLERVRTLVELEAEPPLKILRDYDPSIPDLLIDPELMVQVFLNVARNALQSLLEEHTREPSLSFVSRIERQFTIGTTQHKLVARIDIIDNGPGIPENIRENLFYPLITGRAAGTGLGLSVAQSIVHQHGGVLEYESQPGNTVFTTIIPLEEYS